MARGSYKKLGHFKNHLIASTNEFYVSKKCPAPHSNDSLRFMHFDVDTLKMSLGAWHRYIKSFEFNKVKLDECRSQISSNDWFTYCINAAVRPNSVV